jgi:hypothetical protein
MAVRLVSRVFDFLRLYRIQFEYFKKFIHEERFWLYNRNLLKVNNGLSRSPPKSKAKAFGCRCLFGMDIGRSKADSQLIEVMSKLIKMMQS